MLLLGGGGCRNYLLEVFCQPNHTDHTPARAVREREGGRDRQRQTETEIGTERKIKRKRETEQSLSPS